MKDTYAEFCQRLETGSGRTPRNLLSLLSVLRHELGLSETQVCRVLASSEAEPLRQLQDKLTRYLHQHDFADSSVSTYRSRLRQLATQYQRQIVQQPPAPDAPLGQPLLYYARQHWGSCTKTQLLAKLSDASGIPVPTLKRWAAKPSLPREQHRKGLEGLAIAFGLPVTTFTGQMPGTKLVERAVDEGIDAQPERPPSPELPEPFRRQLDDLLLFKTKARTPPLHQASFKLTRRNAVALQGGGRWTSTPDGTVASATSFIRQLDRFLRWAMHAHELTVVDLDLSLLCTVELLEGYVDECLTQELYGTLTALLTPLAGLCDPHTGYLCRYHAPRQTWVLADGHETEAFGSLADWQEHARYLHQQMKAWLKDIRHLHREETMDEPGHGRRNIGWLLDRPDASLEESVSDLRTLADDLAARAQRCEGAQALSLMQVAVWLSLSLETPLRVSNWCAIQWRSAAPGNAEKAPCLWWDADQQAYQLRVPRSWLKNRRGREIETIATQFRHPQTLRLLRQLVTLRGALGWCRDSLFVQTQASGSRAAGEPYTRTGLAKAIQTWTGRMARTRWPEREVGEGINPHALRHFLATYVLERTGDFRLAATALMDSVSVVMSVYGRNDHAANQRRLSELQQD